MSEENLSSFLNPRIFESKTGSRMTHSLSLNEKKTKCSSPGNSTYSDGKKFAMSGKRKLPASNSYPKTKRSRYCQSPSYTNTISGLEATVSTNRTTRTGNKSIKSVFSVPDTVIFSIYESSKEVDTTIGISLINFSTGEVILTEYVDSQLFIRTMNKIQLYEPTDILIPCHSVRPHMSKLATILKLNINHEIKIHIAKSSCYNNRRSIEFIKASSINKADGIQILLAKLYEKRHCLFSLAAATEFLESKSSVKGLTPKKNKVLSDYSRFRIRYEAIENTLLIDSKTVTNLELIRTLEGDEKLSLFGTLNTTCTKMGYRNLRGAILQPLTDLNGITNRLKSVEELTECEFLNGIRLVLRQLPDLDIVFSKLLTAGKKSIGVTQKINYALLIKDAIKTLEDIRQILLKFHPKSTLLSEIRNSFVNCTLQDFGILIQKYIKPDSSWASNSLELQNQRLYCLNEESNSLLGTLRSLYSKISEEILNDISCFGEKHCIHASPNFRTGVGFFIKVSDSDYIKIEKNRVNIINKVNKRGHVEFTTLPLTKKNIRLNTLITEIETLSESLVTELLYTLSKSVEELFILTESSALLDLLCCFAHNAIEYSYCFPKFSDKIFVIDARDPVMERLIKNYIRNDISSTLYSSRLQIITGANMTGKTAFLRQIPLLCIMAQMGSPIPAENAILPVYENIHTRLCNDSMEMTSSNFSFEMKEMAYILECCNAESLIIIDELGRGTSIGDGFAISLAILNYLSKLESTTFISTHFDVIPMILKNKPSIRHLHMKAQIINCNEIIKEYKASSVEITSIPKIDGISCVRNIFDEDITNSAINMSEAINKMGSFSTLSEQHYLGSATTSETEVLFMKKIMDMVEILKELNKNNGNLSHNAIKRIQYEFLENFAK